MVKYLAVSDKVHTFAANFRKRAYDMTYYVDYNSKFIASYRSIKACLSFIKRKGLKDNYENSLKIIDLNGDIYHPVTGMHICT